MRWSDKEKKNSDQSHLQKKSCRATLTLASLIVNFFLDPWHVFLGGGLYENENLDLQKDVLR